jgi:hypothetical protein
VNEAVEILKNLNYIEKDEKDKMSDVSEDDKPKLKRTKKAVL